MDMSTHTFTSGVAALVAPGLVAGCANTGSGLGTMRGADTHANFSWASTDDRTGTLTAQLSNGQQYSGKFFQVTQDTRVENLAPLWYGWPSGWPGGRYWGPEPDTAFVTHYSGRVVANLADDAGDHMRCHFRLMHPQRGMAGGGAGECQLSSGQTIDANFGNA